MIEKSCIDRGRKYFHQMSLFGHLSVNFRFLTLLTRLFHWTSFCQEDTPTGKNLVPPLKTRSPVVKAVKLMAWRQVKQPLKITT